MRDVHYNLLTEFAFKRAERVCDKLVALWIAANLDSEGYIQLVSRRQVADECGVRRWQVARSLRTLARWSVIELETHPAGDDTLHRLWVVDPKAEAA